MYHQWVNTNSLLTDDDQKWYQVTDAASHEYQILCHTLVWLLIQKLKIFSDSFSISVSLHLPGKHSDISQPAWYLCWEDENVHLPVQQSLMHQCWVNTSSDTFLSDTLMTNSPNNVMDQCLKIRQFLMFHQTHVCHVTRVHWGCGPEMIEISWSVSVCAAILLSYYCTTLRN